MLPYGIQNSNESVRKYPDGEMKENILYSDQATFYPNKIVYGIDKASGKDYSATLLIKRKKDKVSIRRLNLLEKIFFKLLRIMK